MNFLAKKILGNTVIVWIIILTLAPIGSYIIFMKHDSRGFYLLILMILLIFLFENIIFKKKN